MSYIKAIESWSSVRRKLYLFATKINMRTDFTFAKKIDAASKFLLFLAYTNTRR